jgi:MerR family transcriptional regulator, light-induced transcriptional regulator
MIRKDEASMKSYTLTEFAKIVGVSPKVIKQWENDFKSLISIPRTKQGARIYTDVEVDIFQKIKTFYEQKLKKQEIIDRLKPDNQQLVPSTVETVSPDSENTEAEKVVVMEGEVIQTNPLAKDLAKALHHFKTDLLEEWKENFEDYVSNVIKEEISKGANEIIERFNHIVAGSTLEVKDCIKQVGDKNETSTNSMIRKMEQLKESAENKYDVIQEKLTDFSETSTKKLEELAKTLQSEKEDYLLTLEKERKFYEQKIIERERAFRELVLSFRGAAASEKKQRKWWKFWSMN